LTKAFFRIILLTKISRGEVISIPAIIVGEDEALDRAIKRFKRMVEKEGIVREWKRREFYEKPSTIRNRKKKAMERKRLRKVRKFGHGKRF
jgi:small subunit ribosomal protein S21